jgi:hypothetical protein
MTAVRSFRVLFQSVHNPFCRLFISFRDFLQLLQRMVSKLYVHTRYVLVTFNSDQYLHFETEQNTTLRFLSRHRIGRCIIIDKNQRSPRPGKHTLQPYSILAPPSTGKCPAMERAIGDPEEKCKRKAGIRVAYTAPLGCITKMPDLYGTTRRNAMPAADKTTGRGVPRPAGKRLKN